MKKLMIRLCAVALISVSIFSPISADAAPPTRSVVQPKVVSIVDLDKCYSHTTAAKDNGNCANIEFSGTSLIVMRSAWERYKRPDIITVLKGSEIVLEERIDWSGTTDQSSFGYEATLDLDLLSDGAYALTITSGDEISRYPILKILFTKASGECYIPQQNIVSKQYNYGLLQLLQRGNAPNDFAVLKRQYGQPENSQTLLDIQETAEELTVSCQSATEMVMAINRWISENIAFDIDLAGDAFEVWIQSNPQDAVLIDDPLLAFQNGYAFCYGYAKLTVLMMGYAGVECVYIRGRRIPDYADMTNAEITKDVMNHAWNAVNIDGAWYFIDTCDDAVNYHRRSESFSYTERAYSSTHRNMFPSLESLSDKKIALRLGIQNYGKRLSPSPVPNGL